jgi:hypothetical protein
MLDAWQSLRSAREIKTLVFPVHISATKFHYYFQLVKQFAEIELKEVTRDPTKKSVFPKRDWNRDRVCLNFVGEEQLVSDEWGTLYASRRLLAALGLVDASSLLDMQRADRLFHERLKHLGIEPILQEDTPRKMSPDAGDIDIGRVFCKCLCVETPLDIADPDLHTLVVIPHQTERLSFYLRSFFTDWAYQLTLWLEHRVQEAQSVIFPSPASELSLRAKERSKKESSSNERSLSSPNVRETHSASGSHSDHNKERALSSDGAETETTESLDSEESSPQHQHQHYAFLIKTPLDRYSGPADLDVLRRRYSARRMKQIADWALLAGAIADALNFYQQAAEQTRFLLDWEWYAASVEGVAACHAACHAAERTTTPQQLEEYLKEALTYYTKRQATVLTIECLLKLARLYIHDIHDFVEASNVMMRAYNEMESSFTVQTKLAVTSAMCALYREMGYHRKYAYFLVASAKLCKEIIHYEKALLLLRKAAPLYGLRLPNIEEVPQSSTATSSNSAAPAAQSLVAVTTRRSRLLETGVKNHELHGALLQLLIASAQELDDPKQIILYSVCGLQKFRSTNAEFLHKFRDNVLKMTKVLTLHHIVQVDGLLLVNAVELCAGMECEVMRVASREPASERRDPADPFLFRPTRDKDVEMVGDARQGTRNRWHAAAHQQHAVPLVAPSERGTLSWAITITNPLPFAVSLANIQLHVAVVPSEEKSLHPAPVTTRDNRPDGNCWGQVAGPVTLDSHAPITLLIPVPVAHINQDVILLPHTLCYSALHLTFAQSLRVSQQLAHASGRVILIAPLPTLQLVSSSASASCNLQLFEGECSNVALTIANVGPGCLDILDVRVQTEAPSSTSPALSPPASALRAKARPHTRHASLHQLDDYSLQSSLANTQKLRTRKSNAAGSLSISPLCDVIDLSKLSHSLTSTLPWSPRGTPNHITIPVVARSSCKRLTLTFSYGTSARPEFRRKAQLDWSFTISPGVELLHVAVVTCASLPPESPSSGFFSVVTTTETNTEGEYVLLVFDVGNRTARPFDVYCDIKSPSSSPFASTDGDISSLASRAATLPSVRLSPFSVQRLIVAMRPFSEEEILSLSASSAKRGNTLADHIFNALVSRMKIFWRTADYRYGWLPLDLLHTQLSSWQDLLIHSSAITSAVNIPTNSTFSHYPSGRIELHVSLNHSSGPTESSNTMPTIYSFLTFTIRIVNRSVQCRRLSLNILPMQASSAAVVSETKVPTTVTTPKGTASFIGVGKLEAIIIPPLNPGQEYIQQAVICFRQPGEWRILANCQDLDSLAYYWCMQPLSVHILPN